MAVFDCRVYFSKDAALPVVGRAASLFADKLGMEFHLPERDGDFLLEVVRDEKPFLYLSFEGVPCALPRFNAKAINGTSALSLGVMDEDERKYVNDLLDRIQDLQNGERCSIVLSSTRRGWLKWGRNYGFYYIGRHRDTSMFCFERA